ncbi:isoform 3 of bifunctional epoxide hydrolase 2 [Aspergillus udagawae]|nr:isoform 3 of bifunctional epoxide hydrolase 2 [Aspergillus udagawae]
MLLLSFLSLLALAPYISKATAAHSTISDNGRLAPLKRAITAAPSSLTVEYYEAGPSSGQTVLLVHGFPYSIDAFVSVVPLLVNQGYRVIVPYLRGFGGTRFLYPDTPRSAEQAALGYDIIALMDALHLDTAICAGYDWGTVAVNVATALWPERCTRMVAANSYLIQNRSTAWQPGDPNSEATKWYYYLLLTPRGAAGLAENPKKWTETLWEKNSIGWNFTEEYLDLTVTSLFNPDYVDIAVNFYRNRLLYAPGDPAFTDLANKLDHQPPITVPSVTLDPENSVVLTPTDGSATAKYFTGPRCHYLIPDVGENIPYQAPKAFARAIMEVSRLNASNTNCEAIF